MSLQKEYQKMIAEQQNIETCMALAYETIAHLNQLLTSFSEIMGSYDYAFRFGDTTLNFKKEAGGSCHVVVNTKIIKNFSVNLFQEHLQYMQSKDDYSFTVDDFMQLFSNLNEIYITITTGIGNSIKERVSTLKDAVPTFIVKGLV